MLESIFTEAKIPIIENHCIKSDLQFTAFDHALTTSAMRNIYLLHFDGESIRVSIMPDWRSCMSHLKSSPETGRVYCSSSIQSLE
jgi:hypothetical protein